MVDSNELYELLDRVSTLVEAELRLAARRAGLELVQAQALHYLTRCNRYSDTSAAVADFLGLTRGTVSQTLATLERKGLLTKIGDKKDGRVSHCQVTPAGRKLVDQLLPPRILGESLQALAGDSDVTQALRALLSAMQKVNGGATFGVCDSCIHLRDEGAPGYRCGLTGERLVRADIRKICREHTPPPGGEAAVAAATP